MSRFRESLRSAAVAALLLLATTRPAAAELLLDGGRQIGDTIVFEDSDPNSGRCYFVPKPRVGKHPDGTPKLTFLKYTKSGGNPAHNGGILRFTVGLGTAADEVASLRSQLAGQCTKLGPVPFNAGTFAVVSAAIGSGGVFSSVILGEGKAPLLSHAEAAVSIAISPEGATFIERALRDTNHTVDVVFNLTYAGLTPRYAATATVDWDRVHEVMSGNDRPRIYRRHRGKGGKAAGSWAAITERGEEDLADILMTSGAVTVETEGGEDDSLEAILGVVTQQIMQMMSDVGLGPDEGSEEEEAEGTDTDGGCGPRPVLYQHDTFGGKWLELEGSMRDLHGHDFGDRASSICVPPGWQVVLYADKAFKGARLPLEGLRRIADLKRDKPNGKDWGDRVSSVRVLRVPRAGRGRSMVRRSGTFTIALRSRLRQERETGPIAADIGAPLRAFSGDRRVVRLISLDDPDFESGTVGVALDIEGFDSFSNYINFATVSFRKRFLDPERAPYSGDPVSFNRATFASADNVLEWSFPRLGEASADWFRYEYKESWSFAGGVKVETDWRQADSPFLALKPPLELRTIDLAIDSVRAEAAGVQFVTVKVRNRVAGQERTREVRVRPGEGTWTEHRYYHEANDLAFVYQITWHTDAGRRDSGWQRSTDSFLDLNLPAALAARER